MDDPSIGELSVVDDIEAEDDLFIVARNACSPTVADYWHVAAMFPNLGTPGWQSSLDCAHRLVRCFEACRGVPDERLVEPVAQMISDRLALLNLLVAEWPGGGFAVTLPWREDFYGTGRQYQGDHGPIRYWFEKREWAEAAVMTAAREAAEKKRGTDA